MSHATAHELAAAALSRAAEWVLTHPDLPPPNISVTSHRPGEFELTWHVGSDHAAAAAVIAGVPGHWTDSQHASMCSATLDSSTRALIFYDRAPRTAQVTLVDLIAMGGSQS